MDDKRNCALIKKKKSYTAYVFAWHNTTDETSKQPRNTIY